MLVEFDVGGFDRQRPAVCHRILRVHGEIQDDLLHLAAVGLDLRQVRPKSQQDPDVFPDQPPEHRAHTREDGVQVEQCRIDNLLPAEGEQLAGERRRAQARLLNFFNICLSRVVWIEVLQEELAEPEHDGQQIVEVMRHAAGQPSDGFHLLRLLKLRLQRVALGDVVHGPPQLHHAAVRSAYRLAARDRPTDDAVGADHLELEIVGRPRLDGPCDDHPQPLPAIWGIELPERFKAWRRQPVGAAEHMVHSLRPRHAPRGRRPFPTPDSRDTLRLLQFHSRAAPGLPPPSCGR